VWSSLDGVVVPRLNWTPGGHAPAERRQRVAALRIDPIVLETIEQASQRMLATVAKSPTATKQMKRLTAAVYRDLLGISELDAADMLGFKCQQHDREPIPVRAKGLRKAAEEGRLLWARLGAWPWCCWQPPDGTLPDGWWRDEQIQKALVIWCGDRLPDPLPATPALACQL
jgi:hypothetical protein